MGCDSQEGSGPTPTAAATSAFPVGNLVCEPQSPDTWEAVPVDDMNLTELVSVDAVARRLGVSASHVIAGKYGTATCSQQITPEYIEQSNLLSMDPGVPGVSTVCAPVGWPKGWPEQAPLDVNVVCPAPE